MTNHLDIKDENKPSLCAILKCAKNEIGKNIYTYTHININQ